MVINRTDQKGRCSQCGDCCTDFAFISDDEIHKIRKYLLSNPHIKEQWGASVNKKIHMKCPFNSQEDGSCLIYKIRPRVCRLFLCSQSKERITLNKESFLNGSYRNTSSPFISWHVIFFNNYLQQDALDRYAAIGRSLP